MLKGNSSLSKCDFFFKGGGDNLNESAVSPLARR